VSWGSTYDAVKEAVLSLGRDDVAFLHFLQVYPLHPATKSFLEKADRRIVVENNATAQFEALLRRETGIGCEERILKYDGMPFGADELAVAIGRRLA